MHLKKRTNMTLVRYSEECIDISTYVQKEIKGVLNHEEMY